MRKIREVLRLKFDCGLSVRKIARSLGIGHSSAGDYLCRFAASGLTWPCSLSDAELERTWNLLLDDLDCALCQSIGLWTARRAGVMA